MLSEDPDRRRAPLEAAAEILVSDSERHRMLVNNLASLGTLFANTHWTLLRCGAPRLATSDHPLVPIPFTDRPSLAVSALPVEGTFATSEYRLPLTPRLLLLMTWWDDFNPEPVMKMQHKHVRDHNGVVIAQAERQWFYHPDRRAERGLGPYNPISLDLYRPKGYYPESMRWQVVRQAVSEVDAEPEPRIGLRIIDWDSVSRAQ